MTLKIYGKTPSQLFFTDEKRRTFLTQWISNVEYGLTEKHFCESLVEHGDDNGKEIGKAGLDGLELGAPLVKALKGWFPDLIISSIEISSNEGDILKGLRSAIKELEGGQQVVLILSGLLAFPFALCIGLSILGLYVSHKILDASKIHNGNGQAVYDFFIFYGAPIAILLCGLLITLYIALPNWAGPARNNVNNFPLFKLYKNAALGSLLNTLGNLISCGMKLDDALAAVQATSSPFIRKHIDIMRDQRVGQTNLGTALDTGLFIPIALSPLKVLGSHAEYKTLLFESGKTHQEAAKKSIDRMKLIVPKFGMLLAIVCLLSLIGSSSADLMTMI